MKIKKFIIFVLTTVIAISSTVNISAVNIDTNQYPYLVQFIIDYDNMGGVIQTHKLYNESGNIIATCLDFSNAYIIYDNNGSIVECSSSNKSKYYNINQKTYYGGALNYFTKQDSEYYDLTKNTIIEESKFEKLSRAFEKNTNKRNVEVSQQSKNTCSTYGSQTPTIESYMLRAPSKFDWNNDNTCASLAATIILDHMNTSGIISLPARFSNYMPNLYNSLKYYCEIDYANKGGGSSHESLIKGFNKFYSDHLSQNDIRLEARDCYKATIDDYGRYYFYLNSLKSLGGPFFIGIPGHMTVGYGAREIIAPSGETILRQCIINNGWGQNGICVNMEDIDGMITILQLIVKG